MDSLESQHEASLGERASLSSGITAGRRKRRVVNSAPSISSSLSDAQGASQSVNLKEMAVEALQAMRSNNSQPKDANTQICEYIASELRTLTSQNAAIARSKLRRSFADIIDELTLMVGAKCLFCLVEILILSHFLII